MNHGLLTLCWKGRKHKRFLLASSGNFSTSSGVSLEKIPVKPIEMSSEVIKPSSALPSVLRAEVGVTTVVTEQASHLLPGAF